MSILMITDIIPDAIQIVKPKPKITKFVIPNLIHPVVKNVALKI